MSPSNHRLQRSTTKSLLARHAVSVLGSLVFTLAMLMGFALFQKPNLVQQEAGIEDLKESTFTFTVPPPPPPPPEDQLVMEIPPNFVQFDISPSDSPIKIAASPPNLEVMSMETMTAAHISTSAIANFKIVPGAFKPSASTALTDARHIFDKADVDQAPVIVFRKTPEVSVKMLKEIPNPRVLLTFVVNSDGSVENIRTLRSAEPTFDALIIEAVQEWKFRPAVKKGKIVRCWVIQSVVVNPPHQSRFSAN